MNLSALSIFLLALIALTGISGQWIPDSAAWWRYLLALWVAALAYEWWVVRRTPLKVHLKENRPLSLGKTQELQLCVVDPTNRVRKLRYVPNLPASIQADQTPRRFDLAGRDGLMTLRVTASELGCRPWSGLRVKVLGPLGMAWWPQAPGPEVELSVAADLSGEGRQFAANTRVGEQAHHVGGSGQIHHLRDYVAGDPRQSIDWKASAKLQKWITRVHTEEQSLQIMLVVDAGRTARTQVDALSLLSHYANLASRFAQRATAQGDHVGLVIAGATPDQVIAPQSGLRGAATIHAALSRVQLQMVETDLLAAALAADRVAGHRSLIILMTDLYGQSLAGNFGRSLRLWGRRHLPVVISLLGEEIKSIGELEPAQQRDIYLRLASASYQRAVTEMAVGVQRLGAQVILTQPKDVEARLTLQYQRLKAQHRV